MSFRSKVLDALDIKKESCKLQVNETFPPTFKENEPLQKNTASTPMSWTDRDNQECTFAQYTPSLGYGKESHVNYAVSRQYLRKSIGPHVGLFNDDSTPVAVPITTTLDVLGFVVGNKVGMDPTDAIPQNHIDNVDYLNSYPQCVEQVLPGVAGGSASPTDVLYSGFHTLNGIYDDKCEQLDHIRKSALPLVDRYTQHNADGVTVGSHAHKEWPSKLEDQIHLLNENPFADSLYYSSMRISMLITGITVPTMSDKASNHRGLVRMLIIKPKMPSVRVRFSGDKNTPIINMGYPPHFDTELFYSGKKTLGGRLDNDVHTNSIGFSAAETHLSPTFGLINRGDTDRIVNTDGDSNHYGHYKPDVGVKTHDLQPFDVMTSPINRKAYTVIEDKTFTLDTIHHGVASQRLENIVIPFNKKIRFGGRKPEYDISGNQTGNVTGETFDEPLNMHARPIIMFMSMDQKLSCQVSGYTNITEC